MKKFLLLMFAICIGVVAISAKKSITTDTNVLPKAAQTMLADNFNGVGIDGIKVTYKAYGKEYDVHLTNGTEVEFDHTGTWKEIECSTSEVPSGLLLNSIRDYVAANYPGNRIVKAEVKHSQKYEVELSNGTDLTFAHDGRFIKADK